MIFSPRFRKLKAGLISVALFLGACAHQQPSHEKLNEGYSLRWLGTAGWKLNYKEKTFLIDPYLSRNSLKNSEGKTDYDITWKSDADSIEYALKKAEITEVSGIFISHSHFDHFADVPYLLGKFPNAQVYGSATTCNILTYTNPGAKCTNVSSTKNLNTSGMSVKILRSMHSLIGREKAVPWAGKISTPPKKPLRTSDFVEGGSFMYYFQGEGINLLFQGSANFVKKELKGIRANSAIVASVFYENVDQYQKKLISDLGIKRIFMNHFDDFTLPYSERITPLNEKELKQFKSDLQKLESPVESTVPEFFKEMVLQD